MKIGIVGAGVMGRLLAWQLARQGNTITLFDQDKIFLDHQDGNAAAYTAAGMLTPLSEADSAEAPIVKMGLHALTLWPKIIDELNRPVDFHQRGSIILAHPNDRADLLNFRSHVSRLPFAREGLSKIDGAQLGHLEPDLANRFQDGTFIAGESWVSSQAFMSALAEALIELKVSFIESTQVQSVSPNVVRSKNEEWAFDLVIDSRGLGAKSDLPQLRGVRGEIFLLHAPDVQLQHLIRFMHPRYRIYIVPREDNHYVIGATQIESDSQAPISVRSALELLSAAYAVHPGFGEATIVHTRVNCRPALPDNLPSIDYQDGLMRINGLFRHGFLLAPTLAEQATALIQKGDKTNIPWPNLVQISKLKTSVKTNTTHDNVDAII